MLQLIRPSLCHELDVNTFYERISQANETCIGSEIIRQYASYTEWIKMLSDRYLDINTPPSRVAETFWLVYDESDLVGVASLKHELNDFLWRVGGHIGYAVAIDKRKQGYGLEIMKLVLVEARNKNLAKVLVTCDEQNVASKKIIEYNGGQLENKVYYEDEDVFVCRYWIDL